MPVSEVVFVLVILLGVAMLVTGVCRKLPIPFTVVLVLIGILLGKLAEIWEPMEPFQHFDLSPEIMLFIFLPALIFESGFSLDARQLTKDLTPVLILAIPAMIISTVLIGLGVWWALDIGLAVALVFGALISATDPVAVVALFKELGAPNRLNVLVEGESLLNDATAIVAFGILLAIAVEGGGIGWSDADDVALEFVRVFIGGALFGGLLGFVVCELLYRMRSGITVILTTSIVIAYAGFVIAEHTLHVSGVMAVVGSAISLRRFGMSRFRQDATHSISETWEVIALSCNSLLFLLVGLSVNVGDLVSKTGPILMAIVLVLGARALSVYGLLPLTVRRFRLPHVTKSERHIMWWGGLKGGLAIAVVLSIPAELPERKFLFDLTIGVVLFTLLVSAPTIRPLMERLGLDRLTQGEELEMKSVLIDAKSASQNHLSKLLKNKLLRKQFSPSLTNRIQSAFSTESDDGSAESHENDEYLALSRAYRSERDELKRLYESGNISRYIYLDMQNGLHDTREFLRLGTSELDKIGSTEGPSLFQRLEGALLKRMREKRWSSRLLSRYQATRVVQQTQRNVAHILMCDAVMTMLNKQRDLADEVRKRVKSNYSERRKRYRKQLKQIRIQSPKFYQRYMTNLAARSTLHSGLNKVIAEFQHGDLGTKGFGMIQKQVHHELTGIDKMVSYAVSEGDSPADLLEKVELFETLADEDRKFIERNSSIITFLTNDDIIASYEHGVNFYILIQGRASVWRRDAFGYSHQMAEFGTGDVIGETPFLGEHFGTYEHRATIKAETHCSVIRIEQRPMEAILERYPDILQTLKTIHNARVRNAPKIA
ncbi:MAG: Na(+)/H(+) antiporter NhaG [Gammaproteobacteria bacterium]|nr:Na(+)/H(+) antiporter NhaG [Gammaproteobacteria bacterium]